MRSQEAKQRADAGKVFQAIEDSTYLQDLFVSTTSDAQKEFFIAQLLKADENVFAGRRTEQRLGLFRLMTIWLGRHLEHTSTTYSAVQTAAAQRNKHFIQHRNMKLDFIHAIGLNCSPDMRDEFLDSIEHIQLSKLSTPYPPPDTWMVESDAIDNQWRAHINTRATAADRRHKVREIFRVDPKELQYDAGSNKSMIISDRDSGELLLITIRNFSNHPDLLSHCENVIKRAVDYRKSVRVSDDVVPFPTNPNSSCPSLRTQESWF
jgi:hypothetical protein